MNFRQTLPYLKLQYTCKSSEWHFSILVTFMLDCFAQLDCALTCDWCARSWKWFSYVTTDSPLALCSSKHIPVAVAHAVCFTYIQMGFLLNIFYNSFPPHFIRMQQGWLLVWEKMPKEPVASLDHRASLQSCSISKDVRSKWQIRSLPRFELQKFFGIQSYTMNKVVHQRHLATGL